MALGQPIETVDLPTRERREIFSALAVIILIPTVIVMAAWLVVASQRSFSRSNMSKLAATTAETSARVIQPTVKNPIVTTQKAKTLVGDDLVRVMVLTPKASDGSLQVTTSTDPSFSDSLPRESIYQIAASEQRTVTRELTKLPGTGQLWQGVTPIVENGEIVAYVNSTVTVEDLAARTEDFTARVILLTTGLVVAVVFLLTAHFRLLDYAELMQQKNQNEALRRDLLKIVGSDVHEAVTALKRDLGRLEKTKSPEARRQAITDLREKTANLSDDLSLWKAVREVEGGDVKYRLRHTSLARLLKEIAKQHPNVKVDHPATGTMVNADHTHLQQAIELVLEVIEEDNPQIIELGIDERARSVDIVIERLQHDHAGDPRLLIARYHVEGMGGNFRRARHGDVIMSFPLLNR